MKDTTGAGKRFHGPSFETIHPHLSEGKQVADGGHEIFGLRQDFVFELGLVGAERVHGSDAAHRSVKIAEQLVGDSRGDLRAITPRKSVLVSDEDTAGLAHRARNSRPVIRRERPQIHNLDGNSFAVELSGGDFGAVYERAVGNEADLRAFAKETRLAERNREIGPGIFRAVVRLAVRCLCSRSITGSSQRMAVRSKPQTTR